MKYKSSKNIFSIINTAFDNTFFGSFRVAVFIKNKLLLSAFLICVSFYSFASMKSYNYTRSYLPDYKTFKSNTEFSKPLKLKKITAAEYATDPLILYANLWLCFAVTYPVWENTPQFISGDNAGTTFVNRLKMEPFASGRIDPVTKPLSDANGEIVRYDNGAPVTVLVGDMYAKNLIEPFFFSSMALYLRSKNYHPALMILEIFLTSALYEFTVRPFFMNSSFEQFLKNPGIAVVAAVIFDEISAYLLSTPYIGLHILGYILNPFNALPTARVHPLLFFDPYRKSAYLETIITL
ncbi:MAG TPA: hypothetical protein PLG34_13165 [Spirochaetota bacterium]|nr:MAG: hypothetical protein BWX91_01558 [Spirochaetes bacterium ADurb.Bin133]HNZ28034.1 hypothetical protein [Spirochaetota bacterium]HPY88919.1 hypothetical protein [Spirochaetota bacterium]HQB62508.1 hypothetical protein [Spirochaetota bacterium]